MSLTRSSRRPKEQRIRYTSRAAFLCRSTPFLYKTKGNHTIMNGSKSDKNGSKQAKPQTVLAGAPDKPLVINGIEIQVYVLGNETRVISERGFNESLGTSSGGKANSELESARMPRIAQAKWLRPFISEKLKAVLSSPIEFTPPHGGRTAYGYPAESFVDICEAILKARDKDAISPQQDSIVLQADLILRGLARVGITALIDEATGYQKIREERALAIILERYISWTSPDLVEINYLTGSQFIVDRAAVVQGGMSPLPIIPALNIDEDRLPRCVQAVKARIGAFCL